MITRFDIGSVVSTLFPQSWHDVKVFDETDWTSERVWRKKNFFFLRRKVCCKTLIKVSWTLLIDVLVERRLAFTIKGASFVIISLNSGTQGWSLLLPMTRSIIALRENSFSGFTNELFERKRENANLCGCKRLREKVSQEDSDLTECKRRLLEIYTLCASIYPHNSLMLTKSLIFSFYHRRRRLRLRSSLHECNVDFKLSFVFHFPLFFLFFSLTPLTHSAR